MNQTSKPYDQTDQLCATTLRMLAVDAVQQANSGHPGLPLGVADIVTVLYTRFLKHNPNSPVWPDRDRFVLSAGHGSALLYALLHATGYPLTLEDVKNFRQWGSHTAGHPEYDLHLGIELTTGPLGQGVSTAVGMALAERWLAARLVMVNQGWSWRWLMNCWPTMPVAPRMPTRSFSIFSSFLLAFVVCDGDGKRENPPRVSVLGGG